MNAVVKMIKDMSVTPSMKIELIGPEKAQEFLSTIENRQDVDVRQRTVNKRQVSKLADQMKAGHWVLNGETITISDMGYLLNGQHRCHAIIQSGETVPMMVVRGVPEHTMTTIDQGRARSHSDVLTMAGYAKPLAMILGSAGRFELRAKSGLNPLNSGGSIEGLVMETPADVLEMLEGNSAFVSSGEWANSYRLQRSRIFPLSQLCWFHYRINQIDPDYSDGWLDDFCTGANLANDDPRLWIRSRIVREQATTRKSKEIYKLAWLIKAWDRGRRGKTIKNEGSFFSGLNVKRELNHMRLPNDK